MAPRPNLFVVGAMKSGTTSLDAYLGAHPSVFMAPSKEPTHFVDGSELRTVSPYLWQHGLWRDRARYLEEFADAGDALVVGESSTSYSKLPRVTGVAERIFEFNPDARIVYIMRDPIERTISHYWHQAQYHEERRGMLAAVRGDPHYREVSHYAMQIAPYLELFGPERVRALTLETMRDDVEGVLRDLFAWLGVDPRVPSESLERRNVTEQEVVGAHRFAGLRRLRRWRHWRRVAPLVPAPVKTLGRRLAERKRDRGAEDTGRVQEYLRPLQQAETRELAELLGRDFPEWKTLRGKVGGPGVTRERVAE